MKSLFKSEKGKKEILALYDAKLKALHIEYNTHYIKTKYGVTHVIETGKSSKPKLFLIHGSNGHAPIALETYSTLLEEFHIYAVDVIAQPNKSNGQVMSMKDLSYGEWMSEVIRYFNLTSVYMAGFSLGGMIILKTLEYNQNLVKQAFLTAPAYVVNGNPLKAMFKIFIPMKLFIKSGNIKYLNTFIKSLFSNPDDYAFNYLSVVLKEFEMDFSPIPIISKQSASKIKTPITFFTAKNDLIFPGEKMIKRIHKIFPKHVKTQLLRDSKHVQNTKDNLTIQEIIKKELLLK